MNKNNTALTRTPLECASKQKSPRKGEFNKLTSALKKNASSSTKRPIQVAQSEFKDDSEVCSICQMPFNLLLSWESKEVHASNCLELLSDKLPPCDMGIYCDNTIRNHYAQFNHNKIASHRSRFPINEANRLGAPPYLCNDKEHKINKGSESLINCVKNNGALLSNSNSTNPLIEKVDKEKEDFGLACNEIGPKIERNKDVPSEGTNRYAYCDTNSIDIANYVNTLTPCDIATINANENRSGVQGIEQMLPSSEELPKSLGSSFTTEPISSSEDTGTINKHNPIKIAADRNSHGDYKIKVSVNPKVELNRFVMKIENAKNKCNDCGIDTDDVPCLHQKQKIKVKSVITPKKAQQTTINTYYELNGSSEEKSENFNKESLLSSTKLDDGKNAFKMLMRAQKNGFIVPNQQKGTNIVQSNNPNIERKCPFYKKIPGTSFVVDAFSYGIIPGITKYFLSHFHYDHYGGLTKRFCYPIICSKVTANLIRLKIGVDSKFIRELNLNQPTIIEGVEVTLLDANHCPGSVMFLLKLPVTNTNILHCGDFRACPQMEEYPSLWNNKIDKLYLDTTYCKPEYDFPNQGDAISTCIELIKNHVVLHPKTLIVCGTYTIGKERVFLAIAKEFEWSIWARKEKQKILYALENTDLINRLTDTQNNAEIHVMEMSKVKNIKFLNEYLGTFSSKYNHILSIIPTGWTHQKGSTSESSLKNMKIKTFKNNVSQLEIPYSEHSSFSELKRFVMFLKMSNANSVIPTVNIGNANSRDSMTNLFRNWILESTIYKK